MRRKNQVRRGAVAKKRRQLQAAMRNLLGCIAWVTLWQYADDFIEPETDLEHYLAERIWALERALAEADERVRALRERLARYED